jgi:hypothetical protein
VYEVSSNVPCFDEKETRQEAAGSEPKDGCLPEDDYCNLEEDDCERVTPKSKRVMNTAVNYPEF